jgi:hypothetical protein
MGGIRRLLSSQHHAATKLRERSAKASLML